jgi:STIP1 family protein 1
MKATSEAFAPQLSSLMLMSYRFFQDGNWKDAESLYSQACAPLSKVLPFSSDNSNPSIQKDPTNPKIFTNRAITRIKLQSWDACIDDCIKAVELERSNMKAYYYLAQAQLALNHPNEALSSALTAYEKCLETWSSSTQAVSGLVLQAKKLKWEAKEKEKIRQRSDLLRELEDGLNNRKRAELRDLKHLHLDASDEAEEKADVELSTRTKIEELRNVFAVADPKYLQRRVDHLFSYDETSKKANEMSTGGPRLPD